MFDLKDLKPVIIVTQDSVECPVKNCTKIIARQRKSFKTSDEFMCPDHRIYISPSTFEYKDMFDNLLWNEARAPSAHDYYDEPTSFKPRAQY